MQELLTGTRRTREWTARSVRPRVSIITT